ncbi:phosphotyrosine protein phosphatases I [Acephala macrosclerotiorum]|nr:phosphotyrosine protein phosphatases I [Acephala macrosclerotiorum]
MTKPTALVLCTGNSCRSHMAEGILHRAASDILTVRSAGTKPTSFVRPLTIKVLAEIDIDISSHTWKSMELFLKDEVNTVIIVCGNVDQGRPVYPG